VLILGEKLERDWEGNSGLKIKLIIDFARKRVSKAILISFENKKIGNIKKKLRIFPIKFSIKFFLILNKSSLP
jgi:hypothetical protein